MGFDSRRDFGQHGDGLHRILPHGGLAREHHAIGPIQDSIRHVGCLRTGRSAVGCHGLEHLGCGDHGFSEQIRLPHQTLLNHRHLLNGYLDAEVSPCDHDPVRLLQDAFHSIQGPCALDLGDDEGSVPEFFGRPANSGDVLTGFHKGLAHRVHAVFKGEAKTFPVPVRKGGYPQINAGQIEPFPGAQLSAHHHPAPHFVPGDGKDLQLNEPVIQIKGISRFHSLRETGKTHGGRACIP